ncbi:MAG: hypothetical protein HY580_03040 [Nitrospinae bacterium]|nr:hypothetical protein [Nitrospinota bacterium]
MNLQNIDFEDPFTKFIFDHDISIPLGQIMFFVVFISICLLLKKHSLGLMGTYLFVFYCGFISQNEQFVSTLGESTKGMVVYVFFGLFMAVMLLLGFFQNTKLEKKIKSKIQPAPKKAMFRITEALEESKVD